MAAPKGNKFNNKFKQETVDAICDSVCSGSNIVDSCKNNGITYITWRNWCKDKPEVKEQYFQALQYKADAVDAEIDEIMNEVRDKTLKVHEARLMIDTLKWKAAKYYPKMFGNNSNVTLEGGDKPIQIDFTD